MKVTWTHFKHHFIHTSEVFLLEKNGRSHSNVIIKGLLLLKFNTWVERKWKKLFPLIFVTIFVILATLRHQNENVSFSWCYLGNAKSSPFPDCFHLCLNLYLCIPPKPHHFYILQTYSQLSWHYIYLFIKNVLSTYCVPGPDRDAALMESNKINKYLETLIIVNTVKEQSKCRDGWEHIG